VESGGVGEDEGEVGQAQHNKIITNINSSMASIH